MRPAVGAVKAAAAATAVVGKFGSGGARRPVGAIVAVLLVVTEKKYLLGRPGVDGLEST